MANVSSSTGSRAAAWRDGIGGILQTFSKLCGKYNAFIYPVYNFKAIYSVAPHPGQYFQSLPVATLPPVPGSAEINISDLAKSLACTERSLCQHIETNKKQNTLDNWLQPASFFLLELDAHY